VRLARDGSARLCVAIPVLVWLAVVPGARGQDTNERVASASVSDRRLPKALNFANALLNQRRYELAAEQYEAFLRTNPPPLDAADARYGLAKATLFLNRFDEARGHFEAFLRAAPDHPNAPEAMFRLGESAYLGRDLETARRALEAFVAAHPEHHRGDTAWPYLGDVRLGLGDLAGARQAYETALAEYPEGPLADRSRYYLARVLASQGETDAALGALEKVIARERSEWSAKARLQAGQIQADAGRLDEAVARFEALEQSDPGGPFAAEARLRRGEALVALKRIDEAERLLEPLATGPATPPAIALQAAYALGGLLLDDRDQPQRALAVFESAQSKAQGSALAPMLLYRSAEALARLGKAEEARARYLQVVADFPRDAWADRALLAAARVALDSRDPETARTLAGQLIARYPSSPLRPSARLVEARALRASGRDAEAIPLLRALLDEPEGVGADLLAAARYDLSLAYKASGQPEKAAEVLAEVAVAPSAPLAASARYTLGQTRFEAAQFAEAVEPLRQYVQEMPDSELTPHALAYLAVAEHELGHAEESSAALDRLARGWPESEDLVRVRVRLGEAALEADDHSRAAELLRPVAEGPAGAFSAQACSGLGWALIGLDRFAEAAVAFGDAVEAEPEGRYAAEAAFMRAWSLEKAGQDDEALAAYAEAAASNPDDPQAARARLARARLLSRLDRPADAAEAFAEALRTVLDDAEDRPSLLAEHAWALRDAGRSEESRAAFDALFADHPDSPRARTARLDLAKLAFAEKDAEEVERLLGPLVAEGSGAEPATLAEALYLLGRARFDRAEWAGAREAFGRLAEDFPDSELRDQARFYRAEAAFQADDPEAAAPEFADLAQGADAPDAEPWRATAWMRRVQCLLALKRWPEVLDESDALLAALPDFPQRAEVQYARGRALQSQPAPRFDEARNAYQAAIDAAPGSEVAARAQFMRGETYFFEKSLKDAEREFLAVALTYAVPKWQAAALLEAGKVAEADGRAEDALVSYRKLVEQFPEDPSTESARQRLRAIGG
jgi:TolA-binding protein